MGLLLLAAVAVGWLLLAAVVLRRRVRRRDRRRNWHRAMRTVGEWAPVEAPTGQPWCLVRVERALASVPTQRHAPRRESVSS